MQRSTYNEYHRRRGGRRETRDKRRENGEWESLETRDARVGRSDGRLLAGLLYSISHDPFVSALFHRHEHRDDLLVFQKEILRNITPGMIRADGKFQPCLRFSGFAFGIVQFAYPRRRVSPLSPRFRRVTDQRSDKIRWCVASRRKSDGRAGGLGDLGGVEFFIFDVAHHPGDRDGEQGENGRRGKQCDGGPGHEHRRLLELFGVDAAPD